MKSVPPKIARGNPGLRLAVIVLSIMVAGIAAVVFFFNPATHKFYPVCQFHRLTGLNCPGCGMTRALYALLHGDLATAMHDNALLVIGLLGLLVRGAWFALKSPGERAVLSFIPGRWLGPLLISALIFTILRNLPAFACLSPG